MTKKTSFKPKHLLLALVSIMAIFTQGCVFKHTKPDASIPVPPGLPANTQAIVAITSDGRFELRDPTGRPLPKCRICTPELEKEYGKNCKKAAPDAKVCGKLPAMQVRELITLPVLHLKGSDCWFSWPEGNTMQWWPPGCTPN